MGSRILSKFTAYARNSLRMVHRGIGRYSSSSSESFSIVYDNFGDPNAVLQKVAFDLPKTLEPEEVLVKMMASPINPSDINMIEGSYPYKPASGLPAVGGNEGVGEVLEVGNSVTRFSPGDWVLPASWGFGTWRTHVVCKQHEWRKIDNDIPVVGAATLYVNPCTAYRMLNDFAKLKPGETVIQNSANSAVGQAVIQIASKMGLKTVNIIRDREDRESLVELLKDLGATMVLTEEEMSKPEVKETWKILQKPKLALNGVGGKSATQLLRNLDKGGVMVTYGGMSKQPVTTPTGLFIFKDLQLCGFGISEWNLKNFHTEESSDMFKYICDMICNGEFQLPPMELVHLGNFKDVVGRAMQPFKPKKLVMVMQEELLDIQ